jgi:hypothetical protein
MKVVFLDFDGVLNSSTFIDFGVALFTADQIDARAVTILNGLLERSGAKVVVSSSWRRIHTIEALLELLRARGFTGEIVGVTPSLHLSPDGIPRVRGHEIQMWLDEQPTPVERFVILDDDSEMAGVAHRLVRTDPAVGLCREHAVKALAMLAA